MANEYASAKTKEALKAASGNKQDAQRLLITWAVRDHSLLLGLTKPHLKAIVTSWIDNALRVPKKSNGQDKEVRFTKEDADRMIAGNSRRDKRSLPVPPPKESARQASIMHQIAAAFKKRKK